MLIRRSILNCMAVLFFAALIFAGADSIRAEATVDARAEVNRVVEFTFQSSKSHPDPFNDIEVNVLFAAPDGQTFRVPAFWDGGTTWKVRYSSNKPGLHRFRSECSDAEGAGLNGIEGAVKLFTVSSENPLDRINAKKPDNPFHRHGPIRVAEDHRHFEHADGTPFLWLADTWWMGLCKRLTMDDFKTLTADRVRKGFNVVQIVAGLYPDMGPFDERGLGDGGFPWEKDYSRINPKFFDEADARIAHLADLGLAPCIVGAWGYHLPWLGVEKMKKHWRYIIARWGAYPVFWCIAGEGTMPYYLTPKEKRADEIRFLKEGWTAVAAYVRQTDPWRHPISIHPTDSARNQVADVGVLDFDMLQTGHSDRESIPNTLKLVRASVAAFPPMPTVNAEVCYEGILGKCHDDVVRFMVWSCLLSGAAGHTYGANGIWQVNRRDAPYGKSPHGGNWGETPWDEAMNLPGSEQAGFAKSWLGSPGAGSLTSHPEWATFDPKDSSDPNMIPFCGGFSDSTRVIYLPLPLRPTLHRLDPGKKYTVVYFDPKTGESHILKSQITGDANGDCACPDVGELDHDWVMILGVWQLTPPRIGFTE